MPLAINLNAINLLYPHVESLKPICHDLYKNRGQIAMDLDRIQALKQIIFAQRASEVEDDDVVAERALVSLLALINVIALNPGSNPLDLLPTQFQSSSDSVPLINMIQSVIRAETCANSQKSSVPCVIPRMKSVECLPQIFGEKRQCQITLTNQNPTTDDLVDHQLIINYDTLDSMIKTMSKIRSQLFSVANK